MMILKIALAAFAFLFAGTSFGAGTPTEQSCSDYKPTAEGAARFAELKGACEAIVEMNGRPVDDVNAFVNSVANMMPGTKVELKIFRDENKGKDGMKP